MRRELLKGGMILTTANIAAAASSFVRNLIIARIISVEDFGIASLFALVMSFVEMVSDLAVGKFIVQAKDGDDPKFQATSQSFQILRGIIASLILYFSAGIIAEIFNTPHVLWAFEMVALIPLIRGFAHLDLARLQRRMSFRQVATASSLPQIFTMILAYPLAIYLGDYSVMLWLLILHTVIFVALSHIFAERSYKLSWDNSIISRIFNFGWPLLLNGILMFIILQGDKSIIGVAFSMETLGWYSAAFALTLAPAGLIMKVNYTLLLPVLSSAQNDKELFSSRSELVIQASLIIGILYTMLFTMVGADLLRILFGEKYYQGAYLVSWLAFMQSVRIAKFGPINSAMAIADTKNPLYANLLRGAAYFAAIAAVYYGADILAIVLIGVLGEALSYWFSLSLLSRKLTTGVKRYIWISVLIWSLSAALISADQYFSENYETLSYFIISILLWVAMLILARFLLPELFRNLKTVVRPQ